MDDAIKFFLVEVGEVKLEWWFGDAIVSWCRLHLQQSHNDSQGYWIEWSDLYFTCFQLLKKISSAETKANNRKLEYLNRDRKVERLMSHHSQSQDLLIALAKNKVPRIHQILLHSFRQNKGYVGTLQMIQEAIDGV